MGRGNEGRNWAHSVNYCPEVAILVCSMRMVYFMVGPKTSDHNVTP